MQAFLIITIIVFPIKEMIVGTYEFTDIIQYEDRDHDPEGISIQPPEAKECAQEAEYFKALIPGY